MCTSTQQKYIIIKMELQYVPYEYEGVLYRDGSNLFHKFGDNAQLRPNAKELTRFKINTIKKPKTRIYYIYKKDEKIVPLNNVFFTSQIDLKKYCRDNKLKLGHDVFLSAVLNDATYKFHR